MHGLQLNIVQNHKASIYPYTQVMCYWSLDLMGKAKLKLESGNRKIQHGHQAAILKVTLLKIDRLLSIYTSNVLLKFGLDIQSQTKVRVRKLKIPIWTPGGHFESNISENQQALAHGLQQYAYEIWNWNSRANWSYPLETMPPTGFKYPKIQYGCQAAILKVTLLKINRLLLLHMRDAPVKFGFDIQSQTKVKVRKPKNPIWPAGSHFVSNTAENQWASADSHQQHAHEIWNWNSKANLSYFPETMSSTDGRTGGQGE